MRGDLRPEGLGDRLNLVAQLDQVVQVRRGAVAFTNSRPECFPLAIDLGAGIIDGDLPVEDRILLAGDLRPQVAPGFPFT